MPGNRLENKPRQTEPKWTSSKGALKCALMGWTALQSLIATLVGWNEAPVVLHVPTNNRN
jgi:hypothetical protein